MDYRMLLAGVALGVAVLLPPRDERAATTPQPSHGGRSAGASGTAAPSTSKLDPKALALLQGMRLAAAHSLTFTALSTEESPTRHGPPLAYTTLSDVALQRPDKLRVITAGDGPASEFYYDGKTMMAFAPAENLVAMADAPPTIDAALKAAYDAAAKNLARLFVDNFKKYESGASAEVRAASPSA